MAKSKVQTQTTVSATTTPAKAKISKSDKMSTSKPKSGKSSKPTKTKPTKTKPTDDVKVQTTEKVKTPKPEKVYELKARSPAKSDTDGLNLAVSRVKHLMSDISVNYNEFWAITELTRGSGVEVSEKTETGSVTMTKYYRWNSDTQNWDESDNVVPITEMTEATRTMIETAETNHLNKLKEDYANTKIKSLSDSKREEYDTMLTAFRKEFEANQKKLPENEQRHLTPMDMEEFNRKFNSSFYNKFEAYRHEQESKSSTRKGKDDAKIQIPSLAEMSEHRRACSLISSNSVRFSTKSYVVMTTFNEYLCYQVVEHALRDCVHKQMTSKSGHHKVDLTHVVETTVPGSFPFERYIRTTNSYINAQLSLNADRAFANAKKQRDNQLKELKKTDPEATLPEIEEPEVEYLPIPGVAEANLHNFSVRTYIQHIIRAVRNSLAYDKTDDIKYQYAYSNCKNTPAFIDYCSNLVTETTYRLMSMARNDVNYRGMKTISPKLIYLSINNLHDLLGLDYSNTATAINQLRQRYEDIQANKPKKS